VAVKALGRRLELGLGVGVTGSAREENGVGIGLLRLSSERGDGVDGGMCYRLYSIYFVTRKLSSSPPVWVWLRVIVRSTYNPTAFRSSTAGSFGVSCVHTMDKANRYWA
jgi:hypothetical protein